MNSRKKKSIHQLADGILQFEDKRKSIPQADFTDLQTFLSAYLNTPEPKKRKKLAAASGVPGRAQHLAQTGSPPSNTTLVPTGLPHSLQRAQATCQTRSPSAMVRSLAAMAAPHAAQQRSARSARPCPAACRGTRTAWCPPQRALGIRPGWIPLAPEWRRSPPAESWTPQRVSSLLPFLFCSFSLVSNGNCFMTVHPNCPSDTRRVMRSPSSTLWTEVMICPSSFCARA